MHLARQAISNFEPCLSVLTDTPAPKFLKVISLLLAPLEFLLFFFLFLGFLFFHFRVIFGVVHQENDGFLRFHRDRCPWRQLVVTQAQVHLQGIVKKLVAVGPSNKNG